MTHDTGRDRRSTTSGDSGSTPTGRGEDGWGRAALALLAILFALAAAATVHSIVTTF